MNGKHLSRKNTTVSRTTNKQKASPHGQPRSANNYKRKFLQAAGKILKRNLRGGSTRNISKKNSKSNILSKILLGKVKESTLVLNESDNENEFQGPVEVHKKIDILYFPKEDKKVDESSSEFPLFQLKGN